MTIGQHMKCALQACKLGYTISPHTEGNFENVDTWDYGRQKQGPSVKVENKDILRQLYVFLISKYANYFRFLFLIS
jgi:hypothetical protein